MKTFAHPRTRLPRGARPLLPLLAALALLGAVPSVARASILAADGPGPLPWKAGGVIGFSVDAAAFPDSAGQQLEVYVRLRPTAIAALARGETHAPELRVLMKLREDGRGRATTAEQTLRFEPADTVAGFGRVLVIPFRTRPGVHTLTVRVEARRRLVRGSGAGRPQVAEVTGDVTVPEPQAGRDLSDPEYLWSRGDSTASSVFERGGERWLPNPERLYGLLESRLRASFVARGGPGDERPWRWVARMLDSTGRAIAVRESSGVASRWLNGHVEFDVTTEPAGLYQLEIKAWQEGDAGALLRRSRFSIAWEPDTWLRNPSDFEDEAHFLLKPEDEDRFGRMLLGEQERFLAEFWARRDPTPGTAENERRDLYLRRVSFANQTFGRFGLGKGMFSDMGRAYIRYGEPTEVQRTVIPGKDNELTNLIRQYVSDDDRPIGDIEDRQLGGDMRPFELWIYEGEVPAPPDADPSQGDMLHLHRRLLFLFVDERGLGDFRLRYSTE